MTVNVRETPKAAVEVVEELSDDELVDRHQLELKVERAFFIAGQALAELRNRKLYRSTHRSFEQYCQERFGYSRYSAYYKIAASEVFDNLLTKSQQHPATESDQVLPTRETQVRPLAKLEPDEQLEVWQQAVERAGGRVPTERIVKAEVLRHKGIVEQMKEKNPSPPEFIKGEVCEIRAGKSSLLRQFDGMWGIVEHVGSFSYTVRLSIARDVQQFMEDEMAKVDDEYTAEIRAVAERIKRLVALELEPVDFWVLEGLQRSKYFTPRQLLYLQRMESDYGL